MERGHWAGGGWTKQGHTRCHHYYWAASTRTVCGRVLKDVVIEQLEELMVDRCLTCEQVIQSVRWRNLHGREWPADWGKLA